MNNDITNKKKRVKPIPHELYTHTKRLYTHIHGEDLLCAFPKCFFLLLLACIHHHSLFFRRWLITSEKNVSGFIYYCTARRSKRVCIVLAAPRKKRISQLSFAHKISTTWKLPNFSHFTYSMFHNVIQ